MNLRQWVKFLTRRDTTFHGEFDALVRLAGPDCPRNLIDVGANDGFYASNSYPFVARGWRALLVEPHPDAFACLRERHLNRPHVTCRQLACGDTPGTLALWTGADQDTTHATFAPEARDQAAGQAWRQHASEVSVVRLDALLAEEKFPSELGVLSVDTEGWDLEVLRGLNLALWRPRVIVTEDDPRGLAEKRAYLAAHGYACRHTIEVNSFWVPERTSSPSPTAPGH